VSALRENRFDFTRRQVRVSANYIVKQGNRIEKPPKTREGRLLSLDPADLRAVPRVVRPSARRSAGARD
jgi:hypothetical protein